MNDGIWGFGLKMNACEGMWPHECQFSVETRLSGLDAGFGSLTWLCVYRILMF